MTLSVELINDGALNLLSEMEKLRLIRINVPDSSNPAPEKLSQRFAGALRLSDDKYNAFQQKLKDDRNEWA